MKIEGSGALVAGGASGLGEATARRLHDGGASVTIADVNDERGQALADELGDGAGFVHADVRDEDEVKAAAEQAAQAGGGLRICVCCAGTGWAQKITGSRGPHDLMPFETIIGINLVGTFNVLRFAASAMLANDRRATRASAACASTPRRPPPTTGRSDRSPTRPPRAASWA